MTDAPRLILHLGRPKTATTTLQHALVLNRRRFGTAGYHVPLIRNAHFNHDLRALVREGRAFAGNGVPVFKQLLAERSFDAAPVTGAADGRDVVLSYEPAFNQPVLVGLLAEAFRAVGYRVEIYAYLLRYEKAVVSGYAQNIRNHGVTGSVMDFVLEQDEKKIFHLNDAVSRLRRRAEPDRLELRTFHRAFLKDEDILSDFVDFAGLTGLDPARLKRPAANANETPPLERLEVIKLLNASDDDAARQRASAFAEAVGAEERQRRFDHYYREELREHIDVTYAKDREALLAGFLKDIPAEQVAYWRELPDVAEPRPPLDIDVFAQELTRWSQPPERPGLADRIKGRLSLS